MSSHRGALLPLVALLATLAPSLIACSSSTPNAQNADGDTAPPDSSAPRAAPPPSAAPDTGPQSLTATDRELTPRDCEALGGRYHELVVSDESKKLDPKLTDKQREDGRDAISKGATLLSDRWIESCVSSLVGKFASEEALRCAMSAKSVSAFDVCLNGPETPPPPKK